MGADDGADVLDHHVGAGELLLHHGLRALLVLGAVRVQHDDRAFGRIGGVLQHLIHDEGQGLFTAADLVVGGEGSVRSFGNDGLEVQHGSDGGGCRGNASAALEVLQVVHDEVGLGTELVVLQPVRHILDGFAGAVHLMRLQDQQGHGTGDPEGVHNDELAVRILLQQLLPGAVDCLQGAAELAGEGDEEQVFSFLEDRFEIFKIGRFVQRGSNRRRAVAHHIVIAFVIQHLAEIVKILLAVQGVGHINDRDVVLLFQVERQIAVAVGHEDIILSHDRGPPSGKRIITDKAV